jgi:spore germination protein GerM
MPKPYHETKKISPQPWRKSPILWGSLAALILCIGLVIGFFNSEDVARTTPVAENALPQQSREVILYFAAADGQTLVAETRGINECQRDEDCLRDTVEALIAGPQTDLVPILPSHVVLRGISVADSLISVDFSQELIDAHPGGTQSEILTIYGLVDTLTVNFPHLRTLQILVDGVPVATLKGHIDLRQPINPDFSLVEEGLAPAGTMINLPVGGDE